MDDGGRSEGSEGPVRESGLPRLTDLPLGEEAELEAMELPEAEMEALLERGVLPGCRLSVVRRSPFGDPIVRVEGTVLALRRETASCLRVRRVLEDAA